MMGCERKRQRIGKIGGMVDLGRNVGIFGE